MKCPYCGNRIPTGKPRCPRCGGRIPPRRRTPRRFFARLFTIYADFPVAKPIHVRRGQKRRVRDRRRRALRRLGLGLPIVAAVARLAVGLGRRLASKPKPKQEFVVLDVPTPVATAAPTAVPTAAPPSLTLDSRDALIDLYWWMIRENRDVAQLDAVALSADTVAEVTDKFSNYFDAYGYHSGANRIEVAFKPGLRVLHALELGRYTDLTEEEKQIADQALRIVSALIQPNMTDLEKELAIHDYIADNCVYLDETRDARASDARGFFLAGACQCSGYVDAFRLLGRLAGLEVEMIGGPTTRDTAGSKGHAWNLVRLDGLWYVVDVTWDDLEGGVTRAYFNLPASALADSRNWDQSCCPAGAYAQALDDNYFYYNDAFLARTVAEGVENAVRQIDGDGSAVLLFPETDLARDVAAALATHYGTRGRCEALSDDLNFGLYNYQLRTN